MYIMTTEQINHAATLGYFGIGLMLGATCLAFIMAWRYIEDMAARRNRLADENRPTPRTTKAWRDEAYISLQRSWDRRGR